MYGSNDQAAGSDNSPPTRHVVAVDTCGISYGFHCQIVSVYVLNAGT